MNNILDKIAEKKKKNLGNTLVEEEILNLIERVTESKTYREKFIVRQISEEKTGMDAYRLYDEGKKIIIEATSGVAACVAFNTYLKEICKCFFGPITKNMKLPDNPPKVGRVIEHKSVFLYRYFMNYVTYSYTCLYYKWEDFERLTDWMLMAGINLVLNPVGYEIVWRDTLMELGYTAQEANDDLCGAGNLPWQVMGNMSAFGGDIPEWWFEDQKELGNRITNKMRSFGADIVKPAFYGKVPNNLTEKYPDVKVYEQGIWCIKEQDRPPLIDNKDPMFKKIAEIYYRKSKEHFGTVNYYGGDPFHEGGKTDGINLPEYAKDLVDLMKMYSDASIWFFQGWSGEPRKDVLEGLNKEDVLIGFLSADRFYTQSDLFAGYPWIYMEIGNFGGTRRFIGNIPEFLMQPFEAFNSPQNDLLVGTGMAMEAIENCEIIFDVLAVNSIRNAPLTLDEFLTQHFNARYGYINDNIRNTYDIIIENIYSLYEKRAYKASKSSGLCTCPNLNARNVGWFETKDDSPYDIKIIQEATKAFLKEYEKLNNNECYRFDLMEFCRQANADISWSYIRKLQSAYKKKDKKEFEKLTKTFMHLFDVQEAVVRTDKTSLLGVWLKRARDYGKTEAEKRIFEYNVKNLFTLWCGKPGQFRLRDYAHREYDGMLSNYYKKRWDAYLTNLLLYFGRPEKTPKINWKEHDYVFTLSTEKYCEKPQGDLRKAVVESIKMW